MGNLNKTTAEINTILGGQFDGAVDKIALVAKSRNDSTGWTIAHLSHDYYPAVLASEDAVLGLISINEGGHGSGIDLLEVNSGTLEDKWWIGRKSSASSSYFEITYGTGADYAANPTKLLMSKDGVMSLYDSNAKLAIGTNTNVVGDITLSRGSSSILMDTSDGDDSKRLYIGAGGGIGINRGALIEMEGNEHSDRPGNLYLYAGVSGVTNHGAIRFGTGGAIRGIINKDGNWGIGKDPAAGVKFDLSGALKQSDDFAYLGNYNADSKYPDTGNGIAFGWNNLAGSLDAAIWNVNTSASRSFRFKQLTSASTDVSLLTIFPDGRVSAGANATSPEDLVRLTQLSNQTLDADFNSLSINGSGGASGTFTSSDGKTITVTGGIITSIV